MSDWADHMTTSFTEVRLKKFLEMRGADAGPVDHTVALSAFWVGLMYDQGALDAAWDIVKGWDAATREGLRVAASERALSGEAGGVHLADLAAQVLDLSDAGLRARALTDAHGRDESVHLDVLRDRVARKVSRADDLLAAYQGDWGGDLSRVYASESY
jgi:glutamate--cysteine ligase